MIQNHPRTNPNRPERKSLNWFITTSKSQFQTRPSWSERIRRQPKKEELNWNHFQKKVQNSTRRVWKKLETKTQTSLKPVQTDLKKSSSESESSPKTQFESKLDIILFRFESRQHLKAGLLRTLPQILQEDKTRSMTSPPPQGGVLIS